MKITRKELRAIIRATGKAALDALESDSTLKKRRKVFNQIQDLYEPSTILGQYASELWEASLLDEATKREL